MRITTENTLGQMIFKTEDQAKAFVADISADAEAGETFEVRAYQGGRYHVARLFNGQFETWC
jgi:hypothetical protein